MKMGIIIGQFFGECLKGKNRNFGLREGCIKKKKNGFLDMIKQVLTLLNNPGVSRMNCID